MVEWWKNQCLEDHLHPQSPGVDMNMTGNTVLFIPVQAPCSRLTTSQKEQLGKVKWLLCLDQLSGWTTSWLQGTRPGSMWSHHPCCSFNSLVLFQLLPWWGGPCILILKTEMVFEMLFFSSFNPPISISASWGRGQRWSPKCWFFHQSTTWPNW